MIFQVPWVATGAAADAQYREARSDARDHCRLRNAFFQQVPSGTLKLASHGQRWLTVSHTFRRTGHLLEQCFLLHSRY